MLNPTNLKVTMYIEVSTDALPHHLQKETIVLDNNDNNPAMPELSPPSTKNSDNLQKETIVLDDNDNDLDMPEFLTPSTNNSDSADEDSDDDNDNKDSDTNEDDGDDDEDDVSLPILRSTLNDEDDATPSSLRSVFDTRNQRKVAPNRLVNLNFVKTISEPKIKRYPICGTLDRELCNGKSF